MKNFYLQEIYNNGKTKWKDYDFACAINLLPCVPAHACVIICVSGNSMLIIGFTPEIFSDSEVIYGSTIFKLAKR